MPTSIAEISAPIIETQKEALNHSTKTVKVEGKSLVIPSPFPSPTDWRDCWIYFLMTDRFNGAKPPKSQWDRKFNFHQGGTFEGARQQLGYLQQLGVGALWISPVLKNS